MSWEPNFPGRHGKWRWAWGRGTSRLDTQHGNTRFITSRGELIEICPGTTPKFDINGRHLSYIMFIIFGPPFVIIFLGFLIIFLVIIILIILPGVALYVYLVPRPPTEPVGRHYPLGAGTGEIRLLQLLPGSEIAE